jgi:methylenetetrahydrofolate dehydrogenase (NADP+)/methenyltetrahydrofolate cyclohydrolase/formyltetrahydrofolate synthetase
MKVYPICSGRVGVLARCFPQAIFSRRGTTAPRHLLYTALKTGNRQFSSTRFNMAGQKIDGTAIAKSIREKLGAKIKERQEKNPRYRPSLKIVQGEWHAIEPY